MAGSSMMKRCFWLIRAACCSVAIYCFASGVVALAASGELPAADGPALLYYITKVNPYTQWKLMPGTIMFREGKEPHGALQNVYVNDLAYAALMEKSAFLPDGSMIVKENYSPEKVLLGVTAMYKMTGYNPEKGDYFWLQYRPDGKIGASGKVDGCINCHKVREKSDYRYLGKIK